MLNNVPVITIDGPSGSGKGTISRLLAQKLGWHFLDSGSLYRLLALASLAAQVDAQDEARLVAIAQSLNVKFDEHSEKIWLADQEVTHDIRTESCGGRASQVAAIALVRTALLARQRQFQQPPGLVADGRDMGTVVFPQANLKLFLEAQATERAKRRYFQLKELGLDASLQDLFERSPRVMSEIEKGRLHL